CAYFARRMPEVDGTFIQSESEIAAINMVFGALVAGEKAMTSSSSPGISLKQEGISYMAACQLPGVIVNIMRGGPGLGDIRPAQSDYFQATKGGGHGDYHLLVLAPSTVQEAYDLTCEGFYLAEKYRIPVMILGDGILGQMMEPLEIKPPIIQAKMSKEKDYILNGCKGREPRCIRSLFLREGELEGWNARLQEKYRTIEREVVRAETLCTDDADLILVAYGSTFRICKAVMHKARRAGLHVGLIRPITLWPFPSEIIASICNRKRKLLVVEMSAGQMVEDVRLAVNGKTKVFFRGRTGGGIPDEGKILHRIEEIISS
ncbi:MAG: 3-methyl-2-oxobutanoate dehydrogenase subunit VorB, partial [Candidatus Omnitrophica bacterium]|nr:3-methyl-2-oxobutanoate dehydrogenase subunit VorB [Candidatus Omnitrophota bacterium]